MDDALVATLRLAPGDRRDEIARLLTFADIPFTLQENDEPADLLLRHDAQSVALVVGAEVIEIAEPLSLTELLAGLARALSSLSDTAGTTLAQGFAGSSNAAAQVRMLVTRACHRDVTVLITGESGTGKEVVARALHEGSERSSGPFVPVNCGAIPAELLESELFGHEKGAFTGAISNKSGRFELANGGTLFLDEIGDLPFAMQVKLLRAIEERAFERVGGVKSIVSDVRIVAATNHNLEEKIAQGLFREDLFYRLNVFPIELAPLRERVEDLPLLVNLLMERIHQEQHLTVRFSVDALEALAGYPWPGNVRELANLLQRMALQHPNGLVTSNDLPKKYISQTAGSVQGDESWEGEVLLPVNGIDLKDYLTRLERSLIEQALEDSNSVVARAADKLHIRRTTLVEKMRKHGLGRPLGEMQ